jgi:hypothetical protein
MIHANWRWTLDIETNIVEELRTAKGRVVHICSGASGIGDIRLDRFFDRGNQKTETHGKAKRIAGIPNLKGDFRVLPIKDGAAAATICDPPYDMQRFKKEIPLLINELVRITAPQGKIIFLSPWVIYHPSLTPSKVWLRQPGKDSYPTHKILCVSIKSNSQLTDFH